jgi:hypothetical protein
MYREEIWHRGQHGQLPLTRNIHQMSRVCVRLQGHATVSGHGGGRCMLRYGTRNNKNGVRNGEEDCKV